MKNNNRVPQLLLLLLLLPYACLRPLTGGCLNRTRLGAFSTIPSADHSSGTLPLFPLPTSPRLCIKFLKPFWIAVMGPPRTQPSLNPTVEDVDEGVDHPTSSGDNAVNEKQLSWPEVSLVPASTTRHTLAQHLLIGMISEALCPT